MIWELPLEEENKPMQTKNTLFYRDHVMENFKVLLKDGKIYIDSEGQRGICFNHEMFIYEVLNGNIKVIR